MLGQIVERRSGRHYGIRLRLAQVVQDQWQLRADVVGGSEHLGEDFGRASDNHGMRRLLRHLPDDLSVEELEPLLGSKQAELSRAVVLFACPTAGTDPRVRRRRQDFRTWANGSDAHGPLSFRVSILRVARRCECEPPRQNQYGQLLTTGNRPRLPVRSGADQ